MFEDLFDRAMPFDDHGISVYEVERASMRKRTPNTGLPAGHKAGQYDIGLLRTHN